MQTAQQAIRQMPILVVIPDDRAATIVDKLHADGYTHVYSASNGDTALQILATCLAKRTPIELAIVHINMQGWNGPGSCLEIRSIFDVAVILLGNRADHELSLKSGFGKADDYSVYPLNLGLLELKIEKLLIRRHLHKELNRSTIRNETLFLNVLGVMVEVLEAKDPLTRSHSEKVSSLSFLIAKELNIPENETAWIGVGGMLHDLGKMGIRESILKKPGPLDPSERQIVERHPTIASTILEPIEQLRNAVSYIKHHHEHYDGSGYPGGLSGNQIPLGARIIHVAEAFDSMISQRSYNTPFSFSDAIAELHRCSGSQFDPQSVAATISTLEQYTSYEKLPSKTLGALLEGLNGQIPRTGV